MPESVNTPDLNAIIGNLLSNPDALSGMMNLIGGLRSQDGTQSKSEPKEMEKELPPQQASAPPVPAALNGAGMDISALLPLLSGAGALVPARKEKGETESDPMKRRRCLLEAIRPYLSPVRCENLNLLLRILDVLSLLSPKK